MATREQHKLTPYENAKYKRLLKATDHVAAYLHRTRFDQEGRFLDAMRVIRAWRDGDLMTIDRLTIQRLALDKYSRENWWSWRSAYGR